MKSTMRKILLTTTRFATVSAALILASAAARGDEGLWTFNNFPADKVEQTYGFRPDQRWLDHLRLSSLQFGACSAAFVSPNGLVQTNHHCIRRCIQRLSNTAKDLAANGFYARERGDEAKCLDGEVSQLIDISDVTALIHGATDGKEGSAFTQALQAEKARIARECSGGKINIRCSVVDLHGGSVYNVYKYQTHRDVRLVFAPEASIASFGGDPDNFGFPRHTFDVAYLRVYRDGKPLDSSAHYLRYAPADAISGDVTFVPGHPGFTQRSDTVADLELQRDFTLPRDISWASGRHDILKRFSTRGARQALIAKPLLFSIENELNSYRGKLTALTDPAIMRSHAAVERALRAKVDADPALRAQYGRVWDTARTAHDRYREKFDRMLLIHGGRAFESRLFAHALMLVRRASEVTKPDTARMPEYTEVNLPRIERSITAPGGIYPELEKLTLTHSLTKMRELLGPDDAFVKRVLGDKSPSALAAELIDGTGLGKLEFRKQLLAADEAAIAASTDPMIAFVRHLVPDLQATRKDFEDNRDAMLFKHADEVAKAMLKVYGNAAYPDATFTLRLSYGSVAGYRQDGTQIPPTTTIGGAFERATASQPYKLPDSWIAARADLNHQQVFNFVTTNDIVDGNSGSPVVNKAGEVVGVVFDGNRATLGGSFRYDPSVNRAVAVNVGALREALAKVYRADRILDELKQ